MTDLIPPVNPKGKPPVALSVSDPAKVQRMLGNGWQLAEGETFDPSTVKADKPRELNAPDLGLRTDSDDTSGGDISLDDIPDSDEDEDDDEDGDEDEEPASTTGATVPRPQGTGSLPGLSGKSRDALAAIAKAEGVSFAADATKPDIKRAIEAHRAS